jgi:hypothetical protein
MRSVGFIPRNRLANIPFALRVSHEYCFFLHGQCVRLLKEYEKAEAHLLDVRFRSEIEANEFRELALTDRIEALHATGHPNEAKRAILNTVTMGLTSDCLHHLYEALRCLEKRKVIVALNLLRKPLKHSLLYLSWVFADEDEFFNEFMNGSPEKLSQKYVGNVRAGIFSKALARTRIGSLIDANLVHKLIYGRDSDLERLFQHAVHLVTIAKIEIKTSPQNFNFIFKDPVDDGIYEYLYDYLPTLFLFLTHVIFGLFDRMRTMDEGGRQSAVIRTVLGFSLVMTIGSGSVQEIMKDINFSDIKCANCHKILNVTEYNAMRIVMTESFRCSSCKKINSFPFSWLF